MHNDRWTSRLTLGLVAWAAIFGSSAAAASGDAGVRTIIEKAVAVNNNDWKSQPDFTHHERDINAKIDSNGKVSSKEESAYRVLMINGTPYRELTGTGGEPLSPERQRQEARKLKDETRRRASETAGDRAERIAKYEKDRSEERLLMQQMTRAFQFRLVGEEEIDGHPCYVLDAIPDPAYNPPVTKARVLTGMKGRMWIEKNTYHWVRVQAEVIHPVEFGFFLAKVRPGTSFELDQRPADKSIWLPSHFAQAVNARVLGVYGIRTREDDYFSKYERVAATRAGL